MSLSGAPRRAVAQQGPLLPPGVRLEPDPAPERVPTRYRIEMFSVDWTNPLLRVRLVSGLAPGASLPVTWESVERKRPAALRIQLSEPEEGAGRVWRLALPLAGPAQPGDPAVAERRAAILKRPCFAITPLCPWLPAGAPLEREPEFASPLADSGALVAARWIGRVEDLESLTSTTFPGRCLLGWTSPDAGRGRFALVAHESGGEIAVKDLLPWLVAATGPGDWLAIHSQGDDAAVGLQGWRLAGEGKPRRAGRLGGAIELDAVKPGDLVDWARLPGAAASASTFEAGCEPANLIRGLLWPAPFSPPAWISQPQAEGAEPPWVEVDLNAYRPVERIVVAWPAAVGWSGQFQPRRVTLKASLEQRAGLEPLKTVQSPEGTSWEYRFSAPTPLRQVRLELEPSDAMPLDRRARLAAIQLWGPWDGRTGK